MKLLNLKISLHLLAVAIAYIAPSFNAALAQTADKVHLGFLYPISTHGTHAPLDTNNFSIHVLAGVSAEEQGLAFAGLSDVVRNNVKGLAFAGFSNHVGNKTEGLLCAGFINTYKDSKGIQFAGFSNISTGNIEGAQYAGFLNTAKDVKGAQLAGFANIAKNVHGAQFSGFLNTANSVKGSQFAGFGNVSSNDVKGNQLSGFINLARDVSGTQFGGFINVARKVKGAQIAGFINIADSSDCPIGIVNIIKNGEKSIGLSIDETQTTLLSFRSGGKTLYGILSAGYNWKNNNNELYALEAGLGAHFFSSGFFRLNTELTNLCLEDFKQGEYFRTTFRVLPAIKISPAIEVVGGPALHFVNTNTTEGKELAKNYFWENKNRWSDNFSAFYLGYTAGLNIIF